ncbi:MAG TPA: SprT-like domain-containing protein [Capsulimonadaceae bacterium]|nr:SprT-like domain-containing protein [Capsulimonadaceae bacterium]
MRETADFQDMLDRLAAEFDRLNAVYFEGRLKKPTIEFSTRKTFGGYYQKKSHRIVLSWQAYLEHGWEETLNTFRHEVAHIIHLNHRQEFWELAYRIGVTKKYAAAPLARKRRPTRILVYVCPVCGGQIQRRRRIKNSSCARCDSHYNPRYRLVLVREEKP